MKKSLLIVPFMAFSFLIGCGGSKSKTLPEEYKRLTVYDEINRLLSDEHATWKNHLIKEKVIDSYEDGEKIYTQTIQYDNLGSVIKDTKIASDYTIIITTQYDEHHNIKEIKTQENDKITEVDKFEYKYDKFGNALTTDYLTKKEGDEEFICEYSLAKKFDKQNRCTDEQHYEYQQDGENALKKLKKEIICEYSGNSKIFTKRTTEEHNTESSGVIKRTIETQKLNNNDKPIEMQVDVYSYNYADLAENNELHLYSSFITYYNYNNDNLCESTDKYALALVFKELSSPTLYEENNTYYYHKKIALNFKIGYFVPDPENVTKEFKFTKNEYDEHNRIIFRVSNDNSGRIIKGNIRFVFQY